MTSNFTNSIDTSQSPRSASTNCLSNVTCSQKLHRFTGPNRVRGLNTKFAHSRTQFLAVSSYIDGSEYNYASRPKIIKKRKMSFLYRWKALEKAHLMVKSVCAK